MGKALGWHSSALDAYDHLAATHVTEAILGIFTGLCGPYRRRRIIRLIIGPRLVAPDPTATCRQVSASTCATGAPNSRAATQCRSGSISGDSEARHHAPSKSRRKVEAQCYYRQKQHSILDRAPHPFSTTNMPRPVG